MAKVTVGVSREFTRDGHSFLDYENHFEYCLGQEIVHSFQGDARPELLDFCLGLNGNSPYQQQKFEVSDIYELYPEYYILKVNDFNQWSRVPLDQWLYFLATSDIPDDADAPGLKEAREKLTIMQMSREEQRAYESYWMDRHILENTMTTARGEGKLEGYEEGKAQGREEGRKEGREEGREEGRTEGARQKALEIARKMKEQGVPDESIIEITGLTKEELSGI